MYFELFLLFRYYLTLEKGMAFNLNKIEFFLSKDVMFKFGWNWPSGFGEEDENVYSLQVDRHTTCDQKAHLSFHLWWA